MPDQSSSLSVAFGSPLDETWHLELAFVEGEPLVDTLARVVDEADDRRGRPVDIHLDSLNVSVNGTPLDGDLRQAACVPAGAFVSVCTLPQIETLAAWLAPLLFSGTALGNLGWVAWASVYLISTAVVVGGLVGLNLALGELLTDDLDESSPGSRARLLSGGRNRVDPYAPIPKVYGTWRYFPPMAAVPHTEVTGSAQYLRQAVLWGYGPLTLTDVKVGDTPLASFDDVSVSHETVASTPQALTYYTGDVAEVLPAVTLKADFQGVSVGSTGNSAERTTAGACNEFGVDILFPAGTYRINAKGKTRAAVFYYTVSYRAQGSTSWVSSATYTVSETNKDAYFVHHRQTAPLDVYEVKVERYDDAPSQGADRYPSNRGGNGSHVSARVDDMQWVSLKSYGTTVPVLEPGVEVSSFRIKATDQLNGVVDRLNGLVTSKLRSISSGTVSDTYTNSANPALVALDILTGTANPKPRALSEIDLVAFEGFQDFCASESLEFHHVFDYTNENVYDAAQQACRAGRGSLAVRGGKVSVTWDRALTTPTQLFTRRNVTSYRESKLYAEPLDAVRVSYRNSAANYQPDETIVYNVGETAGTATNIAKLQLRGPTTASGVWRLAYYELLAARYRATTITLGVDLDVLACTRGDLIRVQEPHGFAARITSVTTDGSSNITTMTLDEPFDFEAATTYVAETRTAAGTFVDTTLSNPGATTTAVLTPSSPLTPGAGEVGDLVAVGVQSTSETRDLLVLAIAYGDDLTATLECVDYAPEIFTQLASGTENGDTTPTRSPFDFYNDEPPPPKDHRVNRLRVLGADGVGRMGLRVFVSPGTPTTALPAIAAQYVLQYRSVPDGGTAGEWISVPAVEARSGQVTVPDFGISGGFDVRVFTVSAYGVMSAATNSTGHNAVGDLATPTGLGMAVDFASSTLGPVARAVFSWDDLDDRAAVGWRITIAVDSETNVVVDEVTYSPAYTYPTADVGELFVTVEAVGFHGEVSAALEQTFTYSPLLSIQPLRPHGLEVFGTDKVGQGNDLTFTTADVTVQWRPNGAVRLAPDFEGAGLDRGNPRDPLLRDYVVEVISDAGEVVRTEYLETHAYTYTKAKNIEDHGGTRPDRSPTLRVRMRDVEGNLSGPATITPTNAAPPAPTSVTYTREDQRVVASIALPTDLPDLEGVLVWGSSSDATVPTTSTTLLYDGPAQSPFMFELPASTGTIYLRAAFFDEFGKEAATLNTTGVATVTTNPISVTIGAGSVGTLELAANAASILYQANVTDQSLFTASTSENTWQTVVTVTSAVISGDNGAQTPVHVEGFLLGKVLDIWDSDSLGLAFMSAGGLPVFEYRIVKDLGLGTEEVIFPASGTETKQTITTLGYVVGGTPSASLLMDPGTYTFTLQARWRFDFYNEGTAYFETTASGGTDYISGIKGVGTKWADWLPRVVDVEFPNNQSQSWNVDNFPATATGGIVAEIRIPSADYTGFNGSGTDNDGWIDLPTFEVLTSGTGLGSASPAVRLDPSNPDTSIVFYNYNFPTNSLELTGASNPTTAPGSAYEIRFTQGLYWSQFRGAKVIVDVDEAVLQVTERRA